MKLSHNRDLAITTLVLIALELVQVIIATVQLVLR